IEVDALGGKVHEPTKSRGVAGRCLAQNEEGDVLRRETTGDERLPDRLFEMMTHLAGEFARMSAFFADPAPPVGSGPRDQGPRQPSVAAQPNTQHSPTLIPFRP